MSNKVLSKDPDIRGEQKKFTDPHPANRKGTPLGGRGRGRCRGGSEHRNHRPDLVDNTITDDDSCQ